MLVTNERASQAFLFRPTKILFCSLKKQRSYFKLACIALGAFLSSWKAFIASAVNTSFVFAFNQSIRGAVSPESLGWILYSIPWTLKRNIPASRIIKFPAPSRIFTENPLQVTVTGWEMGIDAALVGESGCCIILWDRQDPECDVAWPQLIELSIVAGKFVIQIILSIAGNFLPTNWRMLLYSAAQLSLSQPMRMHDRRLWRSIPRYHSKLLPLFVARTRSFHRGWAIFCHKYVLEEAYSASLTLSGFRYDHLM